jgi:hypothetical protein
MEWWIYGELRCYEDSVRLLPTPEIVKDSAVRRLEFTEGSGRAQEGVVAFARGAYGSGMRSALR